jgi:16S rRNA (guanine(527)-N(7))-methyltransferase RsmG
VKPAPDVGLRAAVARAVAALPEGVREAAEGQRGALEAYLAFLLARNADVNLVSSRAADPEALASSHLFDALFGVSFLPAPGAVRRLLDLGSGGGFPAIPLLLVRRDLEGTLVESVGKKCTFLREAAERLSLTLDVVNARFPASYPMAKSGPFDVLTTRAVGSAGRLVRAARPVLAPGARALLWTTEPLVRDAVRESRAKASAFHHDPASERRGVLVLECFT